MADRLDFLEELGSIGRQASSASRCFQRDTIDSDRWETQLYGTQNGGYPTISDLSIPHLQYRALSFWIYRRGASRRSGARRLDLPNRAAVFISSASLPYLSYLPYCALVPTGGWDISTINLPTLSILFCHRPTGGEFYGLSNRLAA